MLRDTVSAAAPQAAAARSADGGRGNPIAIRGVRKTFGDFVALDSVDLDIAGGEFLTLLGPSGSGKTTLLMILAGFLRPDGGSVRIGGREILLMPPHKREIGMVFQNYALFPHMTVGENVAYPLKLRKVGKEERRERARQALELVKLGPYVDRRVSQLSGGQRQRVALARAIVFEPAILLMDEPLSALDKKLREEMQIELRHLHERLGMTTVYVTHDQREALTMSDRIAVMAEGRLRQVGSPQEIYEAPADHFVADFIGESSFVPVDVDAAGTVRLAGEPLRIARPVAGCGGRYELLLRPEKLDILTAAGQGDYNELPGSVEEVVYQGESVIAYVRLQSGHKVMLRKSSRHEVIRTLPAAGQPILLGIHPEDTVVVRGE